MTPPNLVALFVETLNHEYRTRDINAVAVAYQSTNGAPVWRVVCEFDTHTETYEIGIRPNAGWHWARLMTEGEYRWAEMHSQSPA